MAEDQPPIEPFELRTGDLLLRPWRDADVEAYWAALQDPAIRIWSGPVAGSREAAAAVVARRRDWSAGDHASWCIAAGTDGALLGSVSLHRIDLDQRDAEIGYWIAPDARGRGVAVRAVAAAVSWAFTEVGVLRVQLYHAVENTASGRVAEKAGFTREGRLRRSHRYGDGEWHDELLWGRLAGDPAPGA
jgi:RimJ/RimL family protein N-acetyltransferase